MSVDEKKRQELEARIKALRRILKFLEQQLAAMTEEAQHEVIETLDPYLLGEDIRRESFGELSEEAWLELKEILAQVSNKCKHFIHRKPTENGK